jgi:ATP synthase protein I
MTGQENSQMSKPADSSQEDALVKGVRIRGERLRRKLREGDPSIARRLAQIGVLGWIVVVPMLIGIYLGHWMDHRFYTGVFWTAPLLLIGLAIGCWSAWRWMNNA